MADQVEVGHHALDPMLGFLDALPDGMLVSDVHGRIVLANSTLQDLSGYTSKELVDRQVELLIPQCYRQQHVAHRDDYHASGLPPRTTGSGLETFLVRKDGREVPVDIALSTIHLGGRTLVLSAVRDATERRLAETTIRESEQRWRTLLEDVRLAVVGLDRDGRVTYANPFLQELTGFDRQELLGRDWFSFCLPDATSDELRAVFERILTSESPAHYVNPIQTKSGQQRTLGWSNVVLHDATGEATGTLSIGDDITGRTLSQERLKAVNEVTRAILDDRPVDEVIRIIAERSRPLVAASVATIVTPGDGDRTLVVKVADGERGEDLEGLRFPVEGSISGDVAESQEPLFVADVSADPRVCQPIVRTAAVGPALFVPLGVADHAFGTLLVGRPPGAAPFTDEERRVIELFASQAAVALEHARLEDQLRQLAVLEDRERIGRELHDGAIQALFATGMRLQSLLGSLDGDAADRVDQAVREIDRVITELRDYIFGLRPQAARRRDATDVLRRLGHELEETAGVVTVVDVDHDALVGLETAGDLVQIVREALSNVGRHAHATTCRLTVARNGDGLLIEVDDDGDGFVLDERVGTGHGLVNLRERSTLLGAALEIDTGPGQGTTIRLTVPT